MDAGPLRKRDASIWKRDPHDYYREPSWCSARLFEVEQFRGRILDPAAGSGAIVRNAHAAGYVAEGSDLVVRNPALAIERDWLEACSGRWESIVSNPPFALCDDKRAGTYPFVERCLERSTHKVALLLPSKWIQSDQRSRWLEKTGLRRVWFLTPRPSMPPGSMVDAGVKPGNGTADFAWYVWLHGYDGSPEVRWLRRDQ